jgi:D-aspartate ligase
MAAWLRNPAVVLNPETAGIGIIHALSLGDVAIVTVGRKWPPPLGRFSRFPERHLTYRPSEETLAQRLLSVADRLEGKGVLFPAGDADLEAVVLEQERLSERYHVPAAPHIGTRIFSRSWQYDIAAEAGVPVPHHTRFRAGERPDLRELRFPLVIEPSSRTDAAGGRAFRSKNVADQPALAGVFAELERDCPGREFRLVENVPGAPKQLYTVGSYSDRQGRVVRSYTGRKISQHPYSLGDASVAESLEVEERVTRQAVALLETAKFHGISQVEFKYDSRDDAYKLLGIKGCSWSWIKLAAFSGVNLPLIQYYDLTGDRRLAAAVAEPQRNDRFFVRDALLELNHLPYERRLVAEVSRRKTRVPAVQYRRDPLLTAVYWLATLVMGLRGGPVLP